MSLVRFNNNKKEKKESYLLQKVDPAEGLAVQTAKTCLLISVNKLKNQLLSLGKV